MAGRAPSEARWPIGSFAGDLVHHLGAEVQVCGWVHRLRDTKSTTFILLQDCSGRAQLVADPRMVREQGVKLEDAVVVRGRVRKDDRSRAGFEVDVLAVEVVGASANDLPFTSGSDLESVLPAVVFDHRPLSLRTERLSRVFRVRAAVVQGFREALGRRRFTEIASPKIVSSGTEGGSNLFEVKYFDRVAYLAQSPQFYKEHGVCGFERVFETGFVYRAEPHATVRHLTEYYSLDLELGFIAGPRDVIELEREVLSEMFERLRSRHAADLEGFDAYLPGLERVPVWEFAECLERLERAHGRRDLADDLDPEAERQLCALAEAECGVAAVFVVGFPASGRPFYTSVRADGATSDGFDLLFRGMEVTTGGQRLHRRADLEAALVRRGIDPAAFASHLRIFELGMPPHGGLAIGAERLTARILGIANIREVTLYPRDRTRITP